MRVRRLWLIGLAVGAAGCASEAAGRDGGESGELAVDTLTTSEAEFAEPFDVVSAVRELSDGRVIVADAPGRTVAMVDFARGDMRPIGREGSGPTEYAFPGGLMAMPGDTTWLVDAMQRRFLVISPSGEPLATVPFPEDAGFGQFRGADAEGGLYYQTPPFRPGRGVVSFDEQGPDSVPIVRWDRASRFDSVAMVKLPQTATQVSGGSGNRIMMRRPQPFAAADAWAVGPNGRVALARVADYRVEWHGVGAEPVRGSPVAHEPVPVVQADREAFMRQLSSGRGIVRVGGGGNMPAPPPPDESDFTFPELKPPFMSGAPAVSQDGRLWIQRSVEFGAQPTYDVFDADGRLVRQVVLPADHRVVGFGSNAVYVARTDEDGLQWLQRHSL